MDFLAGNKKQHIFAWFNKNIEFASMSKKSTQNKRKQPPSKGSTTSDCTIQQLAPASSRF